jgi:flagellar biosynthesis GTPase FlhF
MKTLGKQNIGIVGFSYEITNSTSTSPWITKREVGRKTAQKARVAHGYNWSQEYSTWFVPRAYGHSHIYLDNKGPFYSIIGGYTDYTSHDSSSPNVKADEWGVEAGDKFCIREGYAWNRFLNQEGYSRTYIYLIQKEGINNFLGSRIQSTSKDSTRPWIETNFFGERAGKEIKLTGSYGWSQQYGIGYNHFSLYTDEALKLDNKDAFWGKISEIEQERESEKRRKEEELAKARKDAKRAEEEKAKAEREKAQAEKARVKAEQDLKNIQTELERTKKQNEFLIEQSKEQQAQIQQNFPPNPGKK